MFYIYRCKENENQIGNGAVANVDLKGTKGYGSDWMLIAVGYGFGVMMPAMLSA
ncbi:hypothetical protein EfmGK941_26950 [Enterococcus faecium]|nr:hypothetical protein EfmGK941_26950 [Enterococcus faecium]